MKKLLSIMILLAGVISFTSCSDDDVTYTAPAQLALKSADAFFEAVGGTGSIVVNSSESITATSNAEWLSVAVNGSTVSLTVASNSKLEGRSTTILLKSPSASKEVSITQRGIIYGLKEGEKIYEIADTENAFVKIPVAHTTDVTVTSLYDWMTASFNSATSEITVVATSNDDETPRFGLVALQTGDVKDTLVIGQYGLVFKLEKTEIKVGSEGGIEAVTIEHSKPVTVQSAPEWIECVFNDETNILTLSIDESTEPLREGIISLTSGNSTKTITVIQEKSDSTGTEEPTENPLMGAYNFYFVYNDNTYNMGPFTIEEYVGEDAEEGDITLKDFYVPESEIYGFIDGDKLYIYAYQTLGILNDPDDGDYGNLVMSASDQDLIEFDITPDGIVSTDLCILATDPGYTSGWWWEIPSGGTTILVQDAAAARTTHRAAAKSGFKANKSRQNLPKGFRLYHK